MMATVMVRSNDRILKSALELFSDKGYEATSVREICEAAGITKPTLYHFYGSKEGVYRALVEGALERHEAGSLGAPILLPVLQRKLERDFDRRGAVIAEKDT